MDRMAAVMAVIEGYAEHVMDEASVDVPELAVMRERMDARRARRTGLADMIARVLGMGAKLRQYELGKRWCDAVVAEAGIEGLDRVWETPEALPTLAELDDAQAWIRRVLSLVATSKRLTPGLTPRALAAVHGLFTPAGVTPATVRSTNTCSHSLLTCLFVSNLHREPITQEGVKSKMATAKSSTTKTTTTKAQLSAAAKKAAETRAQNQQTVAETAIAYVRETAERAVDVPVGAALTVAETVKPLTETTSREREIKRLRTQVTREINKLERRGGQARRKARPASAAPATVSSAI